MWVVEHCEDWADHFMIKQNMKHFRFCSKWIKKLMMTNKILKARMGSPAQNEPNDCQIQRWPHKEIDDWKCALN